MAERIYKIVTVAAAIATPFVALEVHGRGVRIDELAQGKLREEATVTQLRQELRDVRHILANAENECTRLRGQCSAYEKREKLNTVTEVLGILSVGAFTTAAMLR